MWIKGRQGGDYEKKLLLVGRWYDCYLIRYFPNYVMPSHKDEVGNMRHYRLNIVLWGKGKFTCEKTIFNFFNKIILFRPDLYLHDVKVYDNMRYVLSIGWILIEKERK